MSTRGTPLIALSIAFVIAMAAPAGAHAEYQDADPAKGASVSVPGSVSVTLTEPPAPGGTMAVTDGCGDTVADAPEISDNEMSVDVASGEPGEWKVRFQVISKVDGHPTRDTYSFDVSGKADCESGNDDPAADDPAAAPDDGADGGSFPVVPVVVGGAVLVALALLLRRSMSG